MTDELIHRLRHLTLDTGWLTGDEAADTIEALRSEVIDLQNTIIRLTRELGEARDALREAYEVYAGMDGFIPETAPEG